MGMAVFGIGFAIGCYFIAMGLEQIGIGLANFGLGHKQEDEEDDEDRA